MSKLTPVMLSLVLGAATLLGASAPYDLAQRHLDIDHSVAAELIKADAVHMAMTEARNEVPLPPGMALVMPRDGSAPIVLARRTA